MVCEYNRDNKEHEVLKINKQVNQGNIWHEANLAHLFYIATNMPKGSPIPSD